MTLVTASIDIDAPPEEVYDLVLDPARLDEWVTIHRRVNARDAGAPREGYEMEQTLHLRGANFKVHWTLTEAEPARSRHLGGPRARALLRAHQLRARATATAARPASSTRTSSSRRAGSSAPRRSRMLIGGVPEREATRSLQRLKALIENGKGTG